MSQSNECPVSSIASEFDTISAAREVADGEVSSADTTAGRKLQLRRDLTYFEDHISYLRSAATFNQASSVEGALFQIGVAFDDLQEMASEMPEEFRERLRRVDRALYSAARGIEEGTGKKSAARSRLMPAGLSPFAPTQAKSSIVTLVRT